MVIKTADAVITKIEGSARVEALIGTGVIALIGLMSEKIYTGAPIPIEIFWGIATLGAFYFGFQFIAYLKFYIEKMVYLKEQEVLTSLRIRELETQLELKKIG